MADREHPTVQVERAVLGSMMMSKNSADRAVSIVGEVPQSFIEPAHQTIYAALLRLHQQKRVIDPITLNDELKAHEQSDQVGGPIYIQRLVEALDHAKLERNAREVAFDPPTVECENAAWLGDALPGYLDLVEDAHTGNSLSIPTGFRELDELLTGLEPGTLTVISGRPSCGKSTLLCDIVRSAAMSHAIPTLWIDQESPRHQLLARVFSAEGRTPLHTIRSGLMNDEDWTRLAIALGRHATAPLLLHNGVRVNTEQVCWLAQESKADLIAVDTLQHLQPLEGRETREREVSDITRALKEIALELNVAVVATAHLNRAPLQRFDPSPTLDDLRESDLIAHLADTVILIERPELRDPQTPRAGEADLVVAKQRNGLKATLTVAFQGHYSRFVDMATAEEVAAWRKLGSPSAPHSF